MRFLGRYEAVVGRGGLAVMLFCCLCLVGSPGWAQSSRAVSGTSKALWGEKDPPMPRFPSRLDVRQVERQASGKTKSRPRPRTRKTPVLNFRRPSARSLSRFDLLKAKQYRRFFLHGRKIHLLCQTDKNIYRPGDTIWGRVVEVKVQGNRLPAPEQRAVVRLTFPGGEVLQQVRVAVKRGHAGFQFFLPARAQSGIYRIQYLNLFTRQTQQFPVYVETPRLFQQAHDVVFLQKRYGPGEKVQAMLRLRTTGQKRKKQRFSIEVRLGGQLLRRWTVTTNPQGKAWIEFTLPARTKGQIGVLMVRGESDGEIVSMVRRIPLLWQNIRVGFFPEGGAAVIGLPSRVYFAVRQGEQQRPVEIEGVIEDEEGHVITDVQTSFRGMGRFLFTPKARTGYLLRITKPAGLTRTFPLPKALRRGLTIRLVDDFHSQQKSLTLLVHSLHRRRVVVLASQDERLLAHRVFSLHRGAQQLALPLRQERRGIVRITLFDTRYRTPLAERLVFRQREKGLRIQLLSRYQTYGVRSRVRLRIRVRNAQGKPVAGAALGVAVVDEKHNPGGIAAGWLAQRYLNSSELTGQIYQPNFYFSEHPQAAAGLDLVMGTHGWRGFAWNKIWSGRPAPPLVGVQALAKEAKQRGRWRRVEALQSEDFEQTPAWLPLSQHLLQTARKDDIDGDGIPNIYDRCSRVFGIWKRWGCPQFDGDKDSVPDDMDVCPKVRGNLQYRGCPAPLMVETNPNRMGIFHKVFFASGEATPRQQGKKVLQQIVVLMKQFPELTIQLEGHADPKESSETKVQSLSLERAKAVQKLLVEQGVAATRLKVEGFGGARPVSKKIDVTARSKNRRVEFRVTTWLPRPWWWSVAAVRVFPTRFYNGHARHLRDRRDTVFWSPYLVTNRNGEAHVTFTLSSRISTFRVQVSGVGSGQLGAGEKRLVSHEPVFLSALAPREVSAGDALAVPVKLHNYSQAPVTVRWRIELSPHLQWEGPALPTVEKLKPGRIRTHYFPLRVKTHSGLARITVTIQHKHGSDRLIRELRIQPRGFPIYQVQSGVLTTHQPKIVPLWAPRDLALSSTSGDLVFLPGLLGHLLYTAEALSSLPQGNFEQISSANFPYVMLMELSQHLDENKTQSRQRWHRHLQKGFQQLLKFATPSGGFAWYQGGQADEVLTAHGLLQLFALKKVYPVPASLLEQAIRWLFERRNGKGRYRLRKSRWPHPKYFPVVAQAFITFALTEVGRKGLKAELQWLQKNIDSYRDPYLWALALQAWMNQYGARHPQTLKWSQMLWRNRQSDGSFQGTTTSITHSQGRDLHVQTTALAMLALLRTNMPPVILQPTMRWLQQQRNHRGFGSTQSTVLALQALQAYHNKTRPEGTAGRIDAWVNQKKLDSILYTQQTILPIRTDSWVSLLQHKTNRLKLRAEGYKHLPFSLVLQYYTRIPSSHPRSPFALQTSLARQNLRVGKQVKISIMLSNRSRQAVWMPLLRIRIPAGLTILTEHLRALQQRKIIDFFQVKPCEVILYLRSIRARTNQRFFLLTRAQIPGHYTGATSVAYPYYQPDMQARGEPLRVKIAP